MHAIVEEDVVADFGANPNGSGKGFDSTTGIEGEIGGAASQSDRVGEAGGCSLVGDGEISNPTLPVTKTRNGPEPV